MKTSRLIIIFFAAALLASCSTTRYVPKGEYLLKKNHIIGASGEKTFNDPAIEAGVLSDYIGHIPNKTVFWIKFSLGFYSIADTSKHDWFNTLLSDKWGTPPVIYDSLKVKDVNKKLKLYLADCGYLKASVSDSVVFKNRKATVYYIIKPEKPYKIEYIHHNVEDAFVREVLLSDSASAVKTMLKKGDNFGRIPLDAERERIAKQLRETGFYSFNKNSIKYLVDSSWNDNTVSVEMNLNGQVTDYNEAGLPIYENHPIYYVSRIVVNTDYQDPTSTIGQNRQIVYDTTLHKGIEIVHAGVMHIKPDILTSAVTFSPYSLYNPQAIEKTIQNIRELGFSASYFFRPVLQDSVTMASIPSVDGELVETEQRQIECVILCTPYKKQSFTQAFEISMTSDYTSAAVTLGYQNRNLFKGAEEFLVSTRGAYDLMKRKGNNNSYEIGVSASLSVPRFTPLIGLFNSPNIRQKNTSLQLNYNIQERPFYHRTVFGGTFGYRWTNKHGARFMISPADISVVHVPWLDSTYSKSLNNPYLINSYMSQVIPGMLLDYYYSSNLDNKVSGYTVRLFGDVNGNLLSLFNNAMPIGSSNGETYRTIGGQRYAQFARGTFEYTGRRTLNPTVQTAWRFHLSGGVPYGNSSSLPFDRKYYVGGSSSMRGWQIRTLGPGGQIPDSAGRANQFFLGDMRMEANAELRINVYDWLNVATFVDAGNIWLNSKEGRKDENFRFDTFYRQLALNTGVGMRLDFSFFLVRLDWGLKLHNPNRDGNRWLKDMGLSNTVFHFAVGLPF